MKHYWIEDKIEVLSFWRNNELIIVNSICPHMGAQLYYDKQKDVIKCPWHGLTANPENCKTEHLRFKQIYRWEVLKIENNNAYFKRS